MAAKCLCLLTQTLTAEYGPEIANQFVVLQKTKSRTFATYLSDYRKINCWYDYANNIFAISMSNQLYHLIGDKWYRIPPFCFMGGIFCKIVTTKPALHI
jgi:hypothetical protein